MCVKGVEECSFSACRSRNGKVSPKTNLVHTCGYEDNDLEFRPHKKYDDELQKRANACQFKVDFGYNNKGRILNVEDVVEQFWGINYEPLTRNSCKRKATFSTSSSGRPNKSPRHSPVAIEVVPECVAEDFVASESDLSDAGEEYEEEEEEINVDQLDPFPIGDELAEFDEYYDQDLNGHLLENPHLDLLLINDLVDELPAFDCETHVIVVSRNVRNLKYELGGIFDNGKFAGVIERIDFDNNELTVRVSQYYPV